MDCDRCRTELSDLIDGLLVPARERELQRHLQKCGPCQGEMRRLSGAVALLREAPALEPPPGLFESVIAALPPPARVRPPRRASGLWFAAAAAVAIFAGLAALLALRVYERDGELRALSSRFAALEGDRAALRAEIAAVRKSTGEDHLKVRAELTSTQALLAEVRRARAEDGRRAEEKAAGLEGQVARLEREKARTEKEVILALREQLARAERKRAALASAPPAAPPPPPRAGERSPDAAAAMLAARSAPPSPVVLRRRGGMLELEIKGPRPAVIPELFRIASSDGEGEAARLALNALEELLGAEGEPAVASATREAGQPGLAGWFNRSMKRIAGEVEISAGEGAAEDGAAPGTEDRRERLRSLTERWRLLSGAGSVK